MGLHLGKGAIGKGGKGIPSDIRPWSSMPV